MSFAKSTRVPKAMEDLYTELTTISDAFCAEHLDDEYALLARQAIAALCRKRPCPMSGGSMASWVCAVLYALGQVNFLSDKASKPYMAMADLCTRFGIGASTGGNKAKVVRKALGISQFDPHWTLPSRFDTSPMAWKIMVDGFIVDARRLPIELQEMAVQKGLIPYVPAPRD